MTDQAVDTSGPQTGPGPGTVLPPDLEPEPLLGRERELRALHEDIGRTGLDTLAGHKAPRARVLLIAGRPGSGRSALARELAAALTERYPDGFLSARLTDPDGSLVPAGRTARRLLAELGVEAPAGAPDDELTAALRAALDGRRVLLLLDDASETEQVDDLLPDTPDCLVVAVARGPLTGIPDVRPCTLGGLGTGAGVALLERRSGEVRVTVDPRAAEQLVEECGGQPAALVLAGGWLAVRPKSSVADLVGRLREQTRRGAAEPAQDKEAEGAVPGPLERVLRHSYEGLAADDRRLLRLLHLAPEGLVDPHTASALAGCSITAATESLEVLTAQGLLRFLPGPCPAYELPGCLLPPLRELAEAADRPAELQLARARMLERTVRLLHSCRAITEAPDSPARRRLDGLPKALRFSGAAAAAEWLTERESALLAGARLAVAEGEFDTLARRLVAALVRALAAHRGTGAAAPELYALHGLVLDVAERRGLHRERAAALLNLADLDARTGRTEEALGRYRAALDAAREGGDPHAAGRSMESVAGAQQELGDWHRAADWYGRALAQRLVRGEHADAARLYGRIAAVHTYAGQYGEAARTWRSAVAAHRRLGDVAAQARALSELARVQEYAGRPEESLRTCHEAIGWARIAEDVRLGAALEVRLADTLDRLGDPAAARLHRETARELLGEENLPEPEPEAAVVRGAGEVGEAVSGEAAGPGGASAEAGSGAETAVGEAVVGEAVVDPAPTGEGNAEKPPAGPAVETPSGREPGSG